MSALAATMALAALGTSVGGYAVYLAGFAYATRDIVLTDAPTRDIPARARPFVTALKPCAGADDDLARCLESCLAQSHRNVQWLFGVRDAHDAAYPVVRDVLARHPDARAEVVFTGDGDCPSPKVAQLAALLPRAAHERVWLSDSNTRVHPDTLSAMIDALETPGVGAVVSPVVGDDERSLGAAVENLHLNAFVAFGTFAAHAITGLVGAPGKSVLTHRATLEAQGGLRELGRYLGEDLVLYRRVRALGLRVVLGRHVVTNVGPRATLRRVAARHVRWMQIRARTVPLAALAEPLITPPLAALAWLLLAPSKLSLAAWVATTLALFACDLAVIARLRGRALPAWQWPLALGRPYVALGLWARGLTTRTVQWHGARFRVGAQSAIVSERSPAAAAASSASCRRPA